MLLSYQGWGCTRKPTRSALRSSTLRECGKPRKYTCIQKCACRAGLRMGTAAGLTRPMPYMQAHVRAKLLRLLLQLLWLLQVAVRDGLAEWL